MFRSRNMLGGNRSPVSRSFSRNFLPSRWTISLLNIGLFPLISALPSRDGSLGAVFVDEPILSRQANGVAC